MTEPVQQDAITLPTATVLPLATLLCERRAVNNLALAALLAAYAEGKAIVDETSARVAVTEVTTE